MIERKLMLLKINLIFLIDIVAKLVPTYVINVYNDYLRVRFKIKVI